MPPMHMYNRGCLNINLCIRVHPCNPWLFLLLVATCWGSQLYAQVSSDFLPLKSAIVLPPGQNLKSATYKLYEDSPSSSPIDADGAIQQHRMFVDLLQKNRIRTFNLLELLENAIANSRKAGEWEKSVSEIFPDHFAQLKNSLNLLTPEALLGRSGTFFYRRSNEGYFDWLIPVSSGFFYTRDFAVSTPHGVILMNSRVRYRKLENPIGRFLFRFAEELSAFPIVFDAAVEGVRCEGGDIIVKDERTLLMGVDHLTDRAAAQKIAARLNMDVIAVSMPPPAQFSGLNIELLHLDTIFNIVDEKKVLTVPYFFLKKYETGNPVVEFLQKIESRPTEGTKVNSLQKAIDVLPKVGWITRYEAGTGEAKDLNMKLGDYLQQEGYEIIPVGGPQGALDQDEYINERVLYELSVQAANVLQLSPGRVVAYAHNKFTNAELQKHGIEVQTFEGSNLLGMLGGPHCLTMPLARK